MFVELQKILWGIRSGSNFQKAKRPAMLNMRGYSAITLISVFNSPYPYKYFEKTEIKNLFFKHDFKQLSC